MKYALTNCKTIRFDYYNAYGNKSNRDVYPIKLLFKEKTWYLQGFCLLKDDYRIFKVYRIKELIVTEHTFDRSCYNSVETNFSYQNAPNVINLKIVLSAQVKHRVYDEFAEKDITKNADGSFSIDIMIAEDDWLYNYIISFAKDIKVIEPRYINDIVRERLKKILENYK